ncbi:MAG: M6 family metalloprotease domain-containing protein [Bacteroidales bacterium]|nr:M6 family metalloprotease domain-containing protein [Bacteroidales bacterium]
MKKKPHLFLCFAIFAIVQILMKPETVLAVVANPEPVCYTQPDGSKLTICLKGDEFIHWAETSDGYTIMTNAMGTYEYATTDQYGRLIFSGIQGKDPGKRTRTETSWLIRTGKGLLFSREQVLEMKNVLSQGGAPDAPMMGGFPSTGTRKLLMILANFSNTTTTYSQTDFNNYLNQVNFNGTGSFRDYYIEVSYGQLIVNTTVTVWVTLPNTHDYYGPSSKWGEFAYQAVVAAKNQAAVNFAEYDNNLDGTVDGVAIIHQGQAQEETGNYNDIWSHSWNLTSAGYSVTQRTFDGVQVNAYTTMPEKNATGMGTIGVMCHEFGHNLGAPDFYDTDYTTGGSYSGTGKWDVMAGGSWNGVSGTKPAHPNAWIKAFFNWTNPVVIDAIQNITLRNAKAYPDVVRYNTQTANEYFLCENRQQTGFDAGIPGHGLIIYHVDGNYISNNMSTNTINTSAHQGLYPVCANATGNPPTSYGTINGTGCPFPGTGNKTSFTDATTPHARSWANANTNFPISNIFEYSPTQEITFCFISCFTPDDPNNFTATPFSVSQINLSWAKNLNNDAVMVAYSLTPYFGTPVTGENYIAGSMLPGGGTVLCNGPNTTFNHTGLNASTTYYYKAWSILTGLTYSSGVTSRATTLCGTISSFPWHEGFENEGAIPGCWTQEQVNNSGLNWVFTAGNGGTNPSAAHNGTYNACLKDKTVADNKTRLITPALNLTMTINPQLSFWHTQPSWGPDQDRLSVYYKTFAGGSWNLLATYSSNIIAWTQETISLPNPSAAYYIAFEGNAKFGFGICLDDVQVANGCTIYVPVSVSIAPSMNPVYQGTMVTNMATACNGGSAPSYQWKVGGMNVTGATSATFSIIPSNNDEVTCILTSNEACAVNNPAISNSVILAVTNIPPNEILQNLDISGTQCFDAIQEITVAGGGTTFVVENGGSVIMIAGQRINYLPGTSIFPGGYLHGSITITGQYCGSMAPSIGSVEENKEENRNGDVPLFVKVFPNPTEGDFTLDLNGPDTVENTKVDIYSMTGECIVSQVFRGSKKLDLSLYGKPAGIYLLKSVSGNHTGMAKIVKR